MVDVFKKIAYLKANPKLAELVPQSDLLIMMADLLSAFRQLETAIQTNKIKGDPGETPVKDRDYPSLERFEELVSQFENRFKLMERGVSARVATIRDGRDGVDGKDAEITQEVIDEVARLAAQVIELPDFNTLVEERIVANPVAVVDALNLLPADERPGIDVIKGLRERLDEIIQYAARASGGTIGKQQVYNWIRQAVSDGTIPAGGGFIIETPVGTIDGSNLVFTVSGVPKYIVYYGSTYFEGEAGYTRSGLTITMPFAPTVAAQFKAFI